LACWLLAFVVAGEPLKLLDLAQQTLLPSNRTNPTREEAESEEGGKLSLPLARNGARSARGLTAGAGRQAPRAANRSDPLSPSLSSWRRRPDAARAIPAGACLPLRC
jgi:hypothetical protein